MKKLIICLFLFSLVSPAIAQDNLQTITLKDGSIIKGEIINMKDSIVKVSALDQVIDIKKGKILSITFVEKKAKKRKEHHGYENQTMLNLMPGNDIGNGRFYSFQMINSYLFIPRVSTGVGCGFEVFDVQVLPIFGEIKYYINNNNSSPYLFVQGGYSFALTDKESWSYELDSKGGVYAGAGLGVRFMIDNHTDIVLALGYRKQEILHEVTEYYSLYENVISEKDIYNRLFIGIGIQFR